MSHPVVTSLEDGQFPAAAYEENLQANHPAPEAHPDAMLRYITRDGIERVAKREDFIAGMVGCVATQNMSVETRTQIADEIAPINNIVENTLRKNAEKLAQKTAKPDPSRKPELTKPHASQQSSITKTEKAPAKTQQKPITETAQAPTVPSHPATKIHRPMHTENHAAGPIKHQVDKEKPEPSTAIRQISSPESNTTERRVHETQKAEVAALPLPVVSPPERITFTLPAPREPVPIHEKTVHHKTEIQERAVVQADTPIVMFSESASPRLSLPPEVIAAAPATDEYATETEQSYIENDIFAYQALLENTPDTSEFGTTALGTVASGSTVETETGIQAREHILDPAYQETTDQLPDEESWLADAFPDLAMLPESLRRPARTEIQAEELQASSLEPEMDIVAEFDDEPAVPDTVEYALPFIEADELARTYDAIAELPVDMPVMPPPDLYADIPSVPIIETESAPTQELISQMAFEVPDILPPDLSSDLAAPESTYAAPQAMPVIIKPMAAEGEVSAATPDARAISIPEALLSLATAALDPATPEQETATIKELITDINILLDEQIARPARLKRVEAQQSPHLSRETVEKLMQLMTIAGYEDPSGALVSFIEHYGYGQLSELMRRLAQLAEAGNRHEFVAATTASGYTFFGQDTATTIGKILLGLHQPGRQPAYV